MAVGKEERFARRFVQHIVRLVLSIRTMKFDQRIHTDEICERLPHVSQDLIRDICMYRRFVTWEPGQVTVLMCVGELRSFGVTGLKSLVSESGFESETVNDDAVRRFVYQSGNEGFIGDLE